MSIQYNDDYRHTRPWWEISFTELCRQYEGGRESEQDCCDRLMDAAGQFGADPLDILLAQETQPGETP